MREGQYDVSYGRLFKETFFLSAFTFGGGYVIVPLMRKRFVEDFHWIDENEMLDIVAIAQSAPGILAVNTSILTGYKLRGVKGAAVTTLATVLPPLVTISLIALFYDAFRDNNYVAAAFAAMQPAVAAIIVDAVIKMAVSVLKGKRAVPGLCLILLCFAASFFWGVNVALIVLAAAIAGGVCGVFRRQK